MRVAAIDCGTNTIRLLVARTPEQSENAGRLVELTRTLRYVRLGQGVDATGRFHPDALARTMAAVEEYAALITELDVSRIRMVATSAARDAGNRAEFFTGVTDRLGVTPEVITGDEEATLSYLGATGDLDIPRASSGTSRPSSSSRCLVMDIGGGSTEFVLGEGDRIETAVSLDIGSVRLTERFLHDDPPTPDQLNAATTLIDEQLDRTGIAFDQIDTWVGVAGTVTTLSAIHQQLPAYDRALVHGSTLTGDDIAAWTARLAAMDAAARAAIPTLPPQRADVIAAGALITNRVARRTGRELRVSESDILDGIALRLADLG
ncbi:Ppx/GppA phosphatase family protein [Microlunatus sp. Y2014]|uniref:Ppx/GppA phosphatase family protein n=1 Tax=Microlunatus sp. Y2014 TaxID=3418488 RepID=UPI003DA6E664